MRVKRLLCSILAFTLVLSTMSFSAFASGTTVSVDTVADLVAAIENASDGDVINIASGTLDFSTETVESITINKAITIQGAGKSHTELVFTSDKSALVIESSNVTIRDLSMKQQTTDNASHITVSKGAWDAPKVQYSDIIIDNVAFEGGKYGMFLTVEDVTVTNCEFSNIDSHHIIIYSVRGESNITSNFFGADTGSKNRHAILFEGGADGLNTSEDWFKDFVAGGILNISGNTVNDKGCLFVFTNWGLVEEMELSITDNTVNNFDNKVVALDVADGTEDAGNEFSKIEIKENVLILSSEATDRPYFRDQRANSTVAIDATYNYYSTSTEGKIIGDTIEYIPYYIDENKSEINVAAQIGDVYYESFEEAVAAINQDGSDTTIKLLKDIESSGDIAFSYGTGDVIFTADQPVIVKQTALGTDWDIVDAKDTKFVIDENVTFEIYDNASGIYLYYGPSLEIKGAVTGGQNWGSLYLYDGDHKVSETGKLGAGRIQTAHNNLEVKGEIDTNYLLVEGASLIADGAKINANVIYDNNNGGQRWGESEFVIKNGSELTTSKLTLSYEDSVLTIDTISSLTANEIVGAGTIEIDVTNYDGYSDLSNVINADLTGFSGAVEVVGGDSATVEIVNGQLVIKAKPVGGPIIGYTGEDRIWGETPANSKESYVVKVYSGETFMGQSVLNNINNIIDGDLAPTWNVKLNPTNAAGEYWTTTWTVAPSMDCQPTHVALEVDGVEVSRTAIRLNGPDSLNKIYAAVTDADGKILSYATSLQNAFDKVTDGGRIELLRDVALDSGVRCTGNVTFTIDGNGYAIKTSNKYNNNIAAIDIDVASVGADVTFENIVFDGIKDSAAIRTVNADVVINNCVFKNCNHTVSQGLLRLYGDATITNSKFIDNTCTMVITLCYDASNEDEIFVIDNCLFQNNTCNGNAVVLYNEGASLTVTDNKFISNTVNSTGNAATLYTGFNGGVSVSGNLFENNTVTTTNATTKRIAGGIFAGFADENCEITENAFVNNTATANGNVAASGIAYSAYYSAGNLDGNYWGGGEPVLGVDFTHEYPTTNDLTVEEYYDEYSLDADGNVVLSDLKPIVSKVVAVQYVENVAESDPDTGLKVYDIVIVAKDEHIINRLNTADLTFENSSNKIAYEIVAAEDITLTHNTDYPNRYMFNFNGKDNVTDTDVALTIGQVRLTGYDAFTFKVADVETNLVTATTIDDNIVSYYAADGLALNTDVDGDGEYLGIIDTEITVPTRELTINITFPNTVVNNAVDYQDMTVTIVGGTVNETIALGTDGESYNFTRELPYNTAYTVTVSGAGYRTARYTVTMTDDKQLNFWNNVMDEAQVVEVGKDSSIAKVTFLAGDIVKDNNINIYDLSAVVSYFGSVSTTENGYAKYDLNRDGVIDSKDVAYVLVSWNN